MNKQEIARIIDSEVNVADAQEAEMRRVGDIIDWMMGEETITMTEAHWEAVRCVLGKDRLYLLCC